MTTTVGAPPGVFASGYKTAAPQFPSTLTGLAGWWDATDASSFSYGTGAQVTEWRDLSPSGLHLTGTASANRRRDGTINGNTTVVFDGGAGVPLTRSSVDLGSLLAPNLTDCMTFIVFNHFSLAHWSTPQFDLITPGPLIEYIIGPTCYYDIVAADTGRITGAPTQVLNTPYVFSIYRSGANMKAYVNLVEHLTRSNAGAAAAAGQTGPLRLGSNANMGHVGEIVHVKRYDATDFAATQSYLLTKWGIT